MASWWRSTPRASWMPTTLAELSLARGRFMREAGRGACRRDGGPPGRSGRGRAAHPRRAGVQAANWNGPRQTVIAGPSAAVKRALDLAAARGIAAPAPAGLLRVPHAAGRRRARAVGAAGRRAAPPVARPAGLLQPRRRAPPGRPAAIASRLGDHLASPVRFADMIEAMHRDGARVFVEVGPGSILGPLVDSILGDRPHLAVAVRCAAGARPAGWLAPVARLVVAGLPLRLERLTAGRSHRVLDLDHLPGRRACRARHAVDLAGQRQPRPAARRPEPTRLGTGPVLPRTRRAPIPTDGSTESRPHAAIPGQLRNLRLIGRHDKRPRSTHSHRPQATPIRPRRDTTSRPQADRGHRVVPADHAGVPRSAAVDDARLPGGREAAAVTGAAMPRPMRTDRSLDCEPPLRPVAGSESTHRVGDAPAIPRTGRPSESSDELAPADQPSRSAPAERQRDNRPMLRHDAPTVQALGDGRNRDRIGRRSPPGCSRPSAIGRATRSRPWGSTSTWRPTWGSTRSSGSRSWGSCATNSRLEGPVGFAGDDGRAGPSPHARA